MWSVPEGQGSQGKLERDYVQSFIPRRGDKLRISSPKVTQGEETPNGDTPQDNGGGSRRRSERADSRERPMGARQQDRVHPEGEKTGRYYLKKLFYPRDQAPDDERNLLRESTATARRSCPPWTRSHPSLPTMRASSTLQPRRAPPSR